MLTQADVIQAIGRFLYGIEAEDVYVSIESTGIVFEWPSSPSEWQAGSRKNMRRMLEAVPHEVAAPIASAIRNGSRRAVIPVEEADGNPRPSRYQRKYSCDTRKNIEKAIDFLSI